MQVGSEKLENWKTEITKFMYKEIKTPETLIRSEFAQFYQITQFIKFYSFQFISVWATFASFHSGTALGVERDPSFHPFHP